MFFVQTESSKHSSSVSIKKLDIVWFKIWPKIVNHFGTILSPNIWGTDTTQSNHSAFTADIFSPVFYRWLKALDHFMFRFRVIKVRHLHVEIHNISLKITFLELCHHRKAREISFEIIFVGKFWEFNFRAVKQTLYNICFQKGIVMVGNHHTGRGSKRGDIKPGLAPVLTY